MKLTIIDGAAYRPISLDSAHRHAHTQRVYVQFGGIGSMVDATQPLLEDYNSTRDWKNSSRHQSLRIQGSKMFIRVGSLPAKGWLETIQAAQLAAMGDFFALYAAAELAQKNPTAETIAALEQERERFRGAMRATLDHLKSNV